MSALCACLRVPSIRLGTGRGFWKAKKQEDLGFALKGYERWRDMVLGIAGI